ncbi:MAG TPA: amidohydrolase, partial [Phaeodactylibacter sp.]|nr:amidohydrolase [Phaeodactylibacter sp.]
MKNIISITLFLLATTSLPAQQTPAPKQTQAILITGATAHLGTGEVIQNAAIAFKNGKLTIVADARTIRI